MTIIIGQCAQDHIVIAADRRVTGTSNLFGKVFKSIRYKSVQDLESALKGLDIEHFYFSDKTKIYVRQSAPVSLLAQAGSMNVAAKQMREALLDPQEFVKNRQRLSNLLLRVDTLPQEALEALMLCYSINLDKEVEQGMIPIIRAITEHYELLPPRLPHTHKTASWPEEFTQAYSWQLLARKPQEKKPYLCFISPTGAVSYKDRMCKGIGAPFAQEYLEHELGDEHHTDIPVKKAVEAVREALVYTNEQSSFCDGYDVYTLSFKGEVNHIFYEPAQKARLEVNYFIEKQIEQLQGKIDVLKEHTKH